MHRIDTDNARPDANGTGKAGYHLNNDLVGVDPTALDPAALNAIQEEICTVIESQDIELVKGTNNQLLAAIQKMIVDVAYPVHRTIEFSADVDPNDLWPWTTWVRFAQGKTTVGVLDGDDDFGTVGDTGGAKLLELTMSLETRTSTEGGNLPPYATDITTNDEFSTWINTGDAASTSDIDIRLKLSEASTLSPYAVTSKWVRTA
ncbi:MAG TPA: hypothetical protein PLW01_06240 [Agitococcus sp.]|nr:hypothetical protein [Agitococcus sp.]